MIYIPEVKKRLEELKPGWMNLTLSEGELFELYDLLDVVILEARKERSAFESKENKPETFLLDFLKEKIQIEVKRFLRGHGLFLQRALDEARCVCDENITKTPTFQEWFGYARQVTRTIILGDSTERWDRKREIKKFESSKGPTACLVLNSNWLYSYRDKLLGEEGTHKNINAVMNPESLLREKQRLKTLDWDDMDSRWTEIEGMKGDGFFIKDKEAVSAAERTAREFKQPSKDNPYYDEPTGYVPGYKKGEIRELIFLKRFAEDALNDWRAGEYPEIKTEQEYIKWIESREMIGRPISEVFNSVEIPETRPNFILYTFGNIKTRGRLYRRLREFNNRLYKQSEPDAVNQLPKPSKSTREVWEAENDELTIDQELCNSEFKEDNFDTEDFSEEPGSLEDFDVDDFLREKNLSPVPSEIKSFVDLRQKIIPLLSLRQKEIYERFFTENRSVIEIAQMYRSSRQNIYKHLNKIIAKINNGYGLDLSLSTVQEDSKVEQKEDTQAAKLIHTPDKKPITCCHCNISFNPIGAHDSRCPFCHELI